MQYNSDFKYDLQLGQLGEQKLAEILNDSKIEVKTDLKAHATKNVFIEYSSRGKPSGISTSEADYYAFVIRGSIIIKRAAHLKDICRRYLGTNRDVLGGDNNTSKGILLPITDLLK